MQDIFKNLRSFFNIYLIELISYIIVHRWIIFIIVIPISLLSNFILSFLFLTNEKSIFLSNISFFIFYKFYLLTFLFFLGIPKRIKKNIKDNIDNI